MSVCHCVFILLLLFSSAACSSNHYTYYDQTSDWYTAKFSCMMINGDLVNADDVTAAMSVLPTDGNKAWTNQIAEFSIFAQYKGCFSTKIGSSFKISMTTETGQETSVRRCMEICTKLGFYTFSLKKDTCDCMAANLETFQMEAVSTCNISCSGDVRDFCGGSSALSVYTANDMSADAIDAQSPEVECYYVIKMRDMLDTQTGSCQDIRTGYLCSICNKDYNNCTTQIDDEASNWYDARDACSRRHGVLSDDRSAVLNAAQVNGIYWTGLRRWVVRKASSEQYSSQLCVACGNEIGAVSCVNRDCEDNYGHVCSQMRMPTMLPLVDITSKEELTESTNPKSDVTDLMDSTHKMVTEIEKSNMENTTYITPADANIEQTTNIKQTTDSTKVETSTTPKAMTSSTSVQTSEMVTQGSVNGESIDKRVLQERQTRIGRIFMVLGFIVGALFVLSVSALVALHVRRKRRSRSENLNGIPFQGRKVMFITPERQRSFTNPGYYEPAMTSFDDVKADGMLRVNGHVTQNRVIENTRTCDDCSTFTLSKNNNLKKGNERQINTSNESKQNLPTDEVEVEDNDTVDTSTTRIQDSRDADEDKIVENHIANDTDASERNDVIVTSASNTDDSSSVNSGYVVKQSESSNTDPEADDAKELIADDTASGAKNDDYAAEGNRHSSETESNIQSEPEVYNVSSPVENNDVAVDDIASPASPNNVENKNTD